MITIDFENLPRWIFASMNKWLIVNSSGVITFTEGTDRDPQGEERDHAEFRLDGPRYTQQSINYWHLWVAVNVLFQSVMDDDDFHRKHVMVGHITKAFAINTHLQIW